jgi:hypothetical protein
MKRVDIHLEATYYNCSLSLVDLKSNEQDYFECVVVFNSGWLSCKRPFTFSRNNAAEFARRIKKITKPFGIVATLEDTNKSTRIRMESTAPGSITISGECSEDSEFEQQARLAFNIQQTKLEAFMSEMDAFLKETS